MKHVLEGSHSVSEAVRLARAQVISAYPITPQTHIVEALSEYCADGIMDARFICVESEHSAMAACIGAASAGVRTFTASSSHGLALMHELLHWAAGARLPVVMAEVNRALGPGWNIWMDQSDSLSQRDTGWIQLYCENGQEVLDSTLQAYRLAETVNLPVMVVLDAFFLSHTYEPVDVPDQASVDDFLPPLNPRVKLDLNHPNAIGQMAPPAYYMEMRHGIQLAMQSVLHHFIDIEQAFETVFQRTYGPITPYHCNDAEYIFVMAGTSVSTCRHAVKILREEGHQVGVLKLKMFRPFPVQHVRNVLQHAEKVIVLDRNCSFGVGGIFAQEIRAALYACDRRPEIYSYISGLGGRDVTVDHFIEMFERTTKAHKPEKNSVWIGLNLEQGS
ncbi:MAG: Pyruvate synthase subunit porA [Candidatus Magnetoglobus multicellularis str. Araruama]|uniref:Pyruvate synthase subunit porA n=1 Tax=Candidatus Magnetoglobus multicellularis str. Araruama TaxID=890399 RepID=A0A1V1P7S6_9BACT|nr:MAG: Pyruvate synthase subunit porA [Candidatus Magnetoglobus multicellularis str. Araruama]